MSTESNLTTAQLDRAAGALLGMAAGDALGAPYEFGPPRGPEMDVAMVGGGVWEPGEWTDDTAMAIAIAEIAATGTDLRFEEALDALVRRWFDWSRTSKDVGIQTGSVLRAARQHGLTAVAARSAAAQLHAQTGRTGGNGSLMRTAPVALAYLHDEAGLIEAARAISELTHHDPMAGEACVLWCLAIRHAVLTGELDARAGLAHVDGSRRDHWATLLDQAERARPADFTNNGWVVEALQGAWSAIATTPVQQDDPAAGVFRADHLRMGIETAVRGGRDADTVAAIAGGLLGATYGASAVPAEWRRLLHGWPGMRSRELVALATRIVGADQPFAYGAVPTRLVQHPHDEGLWLGSITDLQTLPADVDTVISLCRVSDTDIPSGIEQIDVRLVDTEASQDNPNLAFVLTDTVRLLELVRGQGHVVLLHCVAAQSRTPTVAALYGARLKDITGQAALRQVAAVLPGAYPNDAFWEALKWRQDEQRSQQANDPASSSD